MTTEFDKEWVESYLKGGGCLKKDCWLFPMHLVYNDFKKRYELVTTGHSYNGERGMYAVEHFYSLDDIPYVGKWVKCNERGEDLE